jgi:translation elongation factor EF-1beta
MTKRPFVSSSIFAVPPHLRHRERVMPSNLEVEMKALLEEVEKILPSLKWRLVPPTDSEPILGLKVYSGEAEGWMVNVAKTKNEIDGAASHTEKMAIIHLTKELAQQAFELAEKGPTYF